MLLEKPLFQNSCENSVSPISDTVPVNASPNDDTEITINKERKTTDFLPVIEIYKRKSDDHTNLLGINESVDLQLRKSHGKLSMTVPGKKKLLRCSECYKLQRYCPECGMRRILKRHLTGRTSQEDFEKFLAKCLTNSSREYKKMFNKILDEVGKELGFDGQQIQIRDDEQQNVYENRMLPKLKPNNIPNSLRNLDKIGINFSIQVSSLLNNPDLHYALKKLAVKKTDAKVQAVFNCSVEMQTLDDFLNGTVILHQTIDDHEAKNSFDDDENGLITEGNEHSMFNMEGKMQSSAVTDEYTEATLKKKKSMPEVMCNIV